MQIRIGTRGSQLALWQAHYVADLLTQAGASTEIVVIDTKGDKILDKSLAKIGSKGLFTQELEEQLYQYKIDLAVHSAKDLPSELNPGLEIVSFTEREAVNDVLVAYQACSLEQNNLKIGTSSTRRRALLARFYPQVNVVDIRGNLQTRLRKLEQGECDALLLAYAGVVRVGHEPLIVQHLDPQKFVPPTGQGSLALEVSTDLDRQKKEFIQKHTNHSVTALCLRAERAYLKTLQGGCSIPSFAWATLQEDKIQLIAGIIDLEGKNIVQKILTGPSDAPEALGSKIGQEILHAGGQQILQTIRNTIKSE